jgi:4'-phosphopantetheinyl transferase
MGWRGRDRADGPLPPEEAHVWWARRADASARLKDLLDDSELARLDAYARVDDRERFVVGCATSKLAIGRYLDVPAAEIEFARTCRRCGLPHGKPRLRGQAAGALEFSISHAGEFVIVALTRQAPVGVDVERLDRSLPVEELAGAVLADSEVSELSAFPPKEQGRNFLVWWTRKEAIMKATGDGLSMPPSDIVVTPPGEPPRLLGWPSPIAPNHVALFDLEEREGHVASLAVVGACTSVRVFDGSALVAAFAQRRSGVA